ncbi:MAG TPA: hypothetical protein VLB51_05250 [Methylomirabilota bacterium]|nr:hypothetical protein [Methylomirabilota bacterium]
MMRAVMVTVAALAAVQLSAAGERVLAVADRQPMKFQVHALMTQIEAADAQLDEVADRNGWGPMLPALNLASVGVEQIDEFDGVSLRDLCRYSLEVYPDANPDSRIFYYRPQAFALKFDPPDYFMSVEYGAGDDGGANVIIQAQLTPGADRTDLEVLEALLRSYLKERGQQVSEPFLLPLPVTYEADFRLQNWRIDEVTVNGVDPDTGEIQLTLSADVPTKELVVSTLGNANGINGSIRLNPIIIDPDRQNLTSLQAPVARIKLPDNLGGPSMRWRPPSSGVQSEFTNSWPFELRLDYLTYLIRNSDGSLRMGGWSLGGAVLGPGDTARVSTLKLNRELVSDDVVIATFVGDLQRDDDTVRRVVADCTGGVGALPVRRLAVEALDPGSLFDQYSIHKLVVEVRSAHFDPDGRVVESRSYDLDDSDERVLTDPLHLWDDAGDLYHYRIVVITRDGAVHGDRTWRAPHPYLPDQILVGSTQVEEVLAE